MRDAGGVADAFGHEEPGAGGSRVEIEFRSAATPAELEAVVRLAHRIVPSLRAARSTCRRSAQALARRHGRSRLALARPPPLRELGSSPTHREEGCRSARCGITPKSTTPMRSIQGALSAEPTRGSNDVRKLCSARQCPACCRPTSRRTERQARSLHPAARAHVGQRSTRPGVDRRAARRGVTDGNPLLVDVNCNQDCTFCSANKHRRTSGEPRAMLRAIAMRRTAASIGCPSRCEPTLSKHLSSTCAAPPVWRATIEIVSTRAPRQAEK